MPIHVAPRIRAREEALEAAGLEVALDSTGVTIAKNVELTVPKNVPLGGINYNFNGHTYTAK